MFPLPEFMFEGIERYLIENLREKHGFHRYTASEFGLDVDGVRERILAYTERFGIVKEDE